jgi:hypothetical protein
MPKVLLRYATEENVDKVAAQVIKGGLVREVKTPRGTRFELSDAGWQFLREYEEIRRDLGSPIEDQDPQLSVEDRPGLLEFLKDPMSFQLQYEVLRPDVAVVIPTLNEGNTIGAVLDDISRHVEYRSDVLVIDASSDETPTVAAEFGANVLRQHGQGKGTALRQAFCVLESDIIVMMDGDASMRAEEIPGLIKALVSGADIAKGSRFLAQGGSDDLSFIRKLGNLLFVNLVNLIWSGEYTDLCYGFLAFKREALERLKPYLKSQRFQIETEICIRAKKLGMKVVEVPSRELRRNHGKSKVRGIRDSTQIFRTIIRECLIQ